MPKQPHLLIESGDIHEIALIPGDPGRVSRIAEHCENVNAVAENREYTIVNATYNDVGVETVIRVGTIGALQSDIEIGDMIVATAAAKEEGTSKRYENPVLPAVSDFDTVRALTDAAEEHTDAVPVHIGPIVTDDAFYNETDAYVEGWEEANLLAVEMEAAAVFTIARRHGLAAGAICTVDGNLVTGTQKGADSETELPPKAQNNVERAIEITLTAVADIDKRSQMDA
jgi:uridine phosphorylase